MLDLSSAKLEHAAIHFVGNKNNEEGVFISEEELWLDQTENSNAIKKLCTSPFSAGETWAFTHSSELGMNEVFVFCQRLFQNSAETLSISAELAKLLYEKSDHPQVKSGEFMICLLSDCYFQNQSVKGIVFCKMENKDLFVRLR